MMCEVLKLCSNACYFIHMSIAWIVDAWIIDILYLLKMAYFVRFKSVYLSSSNKKEKKIRESHLLTNYSNRPLRSGLLALLPPTHRHPHFLLHTLTSYVIINSLETEIMQEDFTIHRSLALIFLCENTLEVNDFIIGPWHWSFF